MGLLHSKYKTSEEKTLDLWRKSNQPTWDPNLEADSKLEADHLKKPKAEVQNLHNPSLEAASLEADLILEADLVWKQIHPNLWDTLPRPNLLLSPTKPRAVESQGNISKPRAVKSEHLKKPPNLKNCDQALQPCHPKEPMRPGPLAQSRKSSDQESA